jgi:hypothetical protein
MAHCHISFDITGFTSMSALAAAKFRGVWCKDETERTTLGQSRIRTVWQVQNLWARDRQESDTLHAVQHNCDMCQGMGSMAEKDDLFRTRNRIVRKKCPKCGGRGLLPLKSRHP